MLESGLRSVARGIAAAALMAACAAPAQAEVKRPPAAALIAGAKATALAPFQVGDEIKDFKVEAWLRARVGRKGQITWRATSCRAKAEDRFIVNSPICVEAVIRYRNGISLVVGIGFDARAARPEQHPDAMWGEIAVRGKPCEFLRHPDHSDAALRNMDELVKEGRCN
jgi:O-methyltransferase involved in polyketide biosynthesis